MLLLLLIPLALFGNSLVPESSWISDFEARYSLAKILARHPKTEEEALIQYEKLLLTQPKEVEFYIEMGRLYLALERNEEGLKLLYDALERNSDHLELTLALAQAEAGFGHAVKSRDLFLKALCLSGESDKVLNAYADAMMSWGSFYEAEVIFRELNEPFKLVWALTSTRRLEEAEALLLGLPDSPKVREALAKLKLKEKKFDKALCLDDEPMTSKAFKLYAEYYLENGLPGIAVEYYRKALQLDPDDFFAWMGLAETLSTLEEYEEAVQIYCSYLEDFPQNYKLLIGIARVLAWSKNNTTSVEWYDKLIELNPEDTNLYREKAHTLLWDNQFDLAMEAYDGIEKYALEKRTKAYFWNKRFLHSLEGYEELRELHPGEEETLFELAQNNCIVGLCECSNEIYSEILSSNLNHKLARLGLYYNEIKMHTAFRGYFTYWRELGSGSFSQSQIARYRFDAVLEEPLSCSSNLRFIQNTYVENPFYNFKFYPAEGQTIEADTVFNRYSRGFLSVTYKNYFGRFKSRITSRNLFTFNLYDYFQLTVGIAKENEIYNFFGLEQAIQSLDTWVTLNSNITHYWNVEFGFQNYHYNDHNNQVHLNVNTRYALTDDPTLFSIILQGNYRNTAHNSISIVEGTTLIDVIHPYWTPQRYFSGSVGLECRQDYRTILSCEAPQRYVALRVTGETDSVYNNSIQGVFEWHHDYDYCGFELKAYIQRSPQWNAEGVWASFFYRF